MTLRSACLRGGRRHIGSGFKLISDGRTGRERPEAVDGEPSDAYLRISVPCLPPAIRSAGARIGIAAMSGLSIRRSGEAPFVVWSELGRNSPIQSAVRAQGAIAYAAR